MKYMITGSTRADIRLFFPMLKLDVYDTLPQAKQAVVNIINFDLAELGNNFHLKTDNLLWEILDSNNNSCERIQIKKINTYDKKNTEKIQSAL